MDDILQCPRCQLDGEPHQAPDDNVAYRCPTCKQRWKVMMTVQRILTYLEKP